MKNSIQFTFALIFCLSISYYSKAANVLDSRWSDVVRGNCDDQNPAWWSSAEAIRIAENVLLYQKDIGGWYKDIDMHMILSQTAKDGLVASKSNNAGCTIDNGAVKLELTYLSKVHNAIADGAFKTEIATAFLKGVQYLLDAQYDNGGWPQFYPLRGGYSNHITYNDDAMQNAMTILRHISLKDGEFSVEAADSTVADALEAWNKGLDCILNTQYSQDGLLTSWCAQHHYSTLQPVMARSYELASLSGAESEAVITLLMSVDNPSFAIRRAIYHAVNWYDDTRIKGQRIEHFVNGDGLDDIRVVADATAPDMWARFYTLEDNTPFFCDRDGIMVFSIAEITHERRTGYSWYTSAGFDVFAGYSTWYPKWGSNTEQETTITSPVENGEYVSTENLFVKAHANEYAFGSIQNIELFVDDALVQQIPAKKIERYVSGLELGSHTVVVRSTDDLGYQAADTVTFQVVEPSAITEPLAEGSTLRCYPNPAHSDFSIDLSNIGNSDIEIFNLSGRLVYKAKGEKGVYNISDHNLISGIYFIKVTDSNNNIYTQKLIMQ